MVKNEFSAIKPRFVAIKNATPMKFARPVDFDVRFWHKKLSKTAKIYLNHSTKHILIKKVTKIADNITKNIQKLKMASSKTATSTIRSSKA